MEESHRRIYKIIHSKSCFVRIVMRALYEIANFFMCGIMRGCIDKKKVVTDDEVLDELARATSEMTRLLISEIRESRGLT